MAASHPRSPPLLHVRDYARTTLRPRHVTVVAALTEALFAHDEPMRQVDLVAFAREVDRAISTASKTLRFGLLAMLDLLRFLPLFLMGKLSFFENLPLPDRIRLLERMERSRFSALTLVFVAYKTLLTMIFFEEPRELAAMGYPGPARERYKRGLPVAHD
jgi:hypothetical protein